MNPARRDSMRILANRGCFARVRRGFSALATPSAVYDVTVVKDATADYSEEFMHAALVTNLPNYASAIVSTQVSGSRPLAQSSSASHGIGARGETPVLPA